VRILAVVRTAELVSAKFQLKNPKVDDVRSRQSYDELNRGPLDNHEISGQAADAFPSIIQSDSSRRPQNRKTRHLIETAGFILVAGARFELTTFRL
jgi:hypothetical protein